MSNTAANPRWIRTWSFFVATPSLLKCNSLAARVCTEPDRAFLLAFLPFRSLNETRENAEDERYDCTAGPVPADLGGATEGALSAATLPSAAAMIQAFGRSMCVIRDSLPKLRYTVTSRVVLSERLCSPQKSASAEGISVPTILPHTSTIFASSRAVLFNRIGLIRLA